MNHLMVKNKIPEQNHWKKKIWTCHEESKDCLTCEVMFFNCTDFSAY